MKISFQKLISLSLVFISTLIFSKLFFDFKGILETLGYIGLGLLAFLASLSVIGNIPYHITIPLAAAKGLNPLMLSLCTGSGAGLGETLSYWLGRLAGKKERAKLSSTDFKFMFLIFLFALTPLPDDLLFLALGKMNFSFPKSLMACILGKICLSMILAYGGTYFLFLAEPFMMDWVLFLILAIAASSIILIDWEKLAYRYFARFLKL